MKSILCFGDSNTYGLIPGTSDRYEWGIRWTSILDERMRNKGYRVIEEGLCGRTTVFEDQYRKGRNGSELLPVLLEAHNPIDIAVLMLGTNDCKTVYGATPEQIGEGIEVLIRQVQSFDPKIQIVLVSPISLGEGVWEEGYDTEFNRASVEVSKALPRVYKMIAQKYGTAFLTASDYALPGSEDREHMDAKNHRYFAEAVCETIENLIRQESTESRENITYFKEYVS